MSAANLKNKSEPTPAQDAVAFIKNDHYLLTRLLDLFDQAQDRRQMKVLARLTCTLCSVHMATEEQLVYPFARAKFNKVICVHEAEVEHTVAKVLIAELEGLRVVDDKFAATFRVLGKHLRSHFKAEETDMLPQLAAAKVDLKALGHQLAARRLDILTGEGIDVEELLNEILKRPVRRQANRTKGRPRMVSLRNLVERLAAQREGPN